MRDNNVEDDTTLPDIVSKIKCAVDSLKDKLEADDAFATFEEAAKIKVERSGKKWECTALALVLQHIEAGCMQTAGEYLRTVYNIAPACLIHDGFLIDADKWPEDPDFLLQISQAVSLRVGFNVRYGRKLLEMDEEDTQWLQLVKQNTRLRPSTTPSDLPEVDALMVQAVNTPTHYTVAKVVYFFLPKKLVYTDTKSQWFLFEAPRWKDIKGNASFIVSLMDNEILPHFLRFQERILSGECIANIAPADFNNVFKILGCMNFKTKVISQLQSFYQVADPKAWLSALDSNTHILGLKDGVYDFHSRTFREGTPDDMLTMSTQHSMADVQNADPDGPIAQEILRAFYSMHTSKEMADYVLRRFATCVVGDRPIDAFDILTGSGSNGKTLTKAAMNSAFGDYFYEPSSGLLTQKRAAQGACSPEHAKLRGKRCTMPSEAENEETLQVGFLKNLMGGDKIQARDLYTACVEFKPQTNLFPSYNEIPAVNDSSNGLARRLRIVRFPFQFVDREPIGPQEKRMDTSLRDKFASPAYGAAMLRILLDTFLQHGHNLAVPLQVIEDSRCFMLENDHVREFMASNYETVDDYSSYVSLISIINNIKSDSVYKMLIPVNKASGIGQKIGNIGYVKRLLDGKVVFRNLREKESPAPMEVVGEESG